MSGGIRRILSNRVLLFIKISAAAPNIDLPIRLNYCIIDGHKTHTVYVYLLLLYTTELNACIVRGQLYKKVVYSSVAFVRNLLKNKDKLIYRGYFKQYRQ